MNLTIKPILTAIAATLLAGTVQAQSVTIKLATIAPEKSVYGVMFQGFQAKLAELSSNDIKLDVYYGGQLGTMEETMQQTMRGRMDGWSGAAPVLAAVKPELGALTLPYLFSNVAELNCVMPRMVEGTQKLLDDKVHFMGFTPVGWYVVIAKEKVGMPSDFVGKKVRVSPLPTSIDFFGATGGTPVLVGGGEVGTALSTNLVDIGGDANLAFSVATGLFKMAPNMLATNHSYNLGSVVLSNKAWKAMTPAQQEIFTKAYEQSMAFPVTSKILQGAETKMVAAWEKNGGTYSELTPEQAAAWRKVGEGAWSTILPKIKGGDAMLKTAQSIKATCK